jgi:hypothetical protein
MEKYCQNPLCENEAVKQVSVSVGKASDQKRALCAVCEEVYSWGVQHGQMSKPGLQIDPPPKEKGPEPLYRVAYVIDVNAASVPAAAVGTHRIMTDPASLAPVLHVLDHRGGDTIVDLATAPFAAALEGRADAARQKARAFVLAGGTQCPACGRREIDLGTVELDAECAYQKAWCRHCQAKFCSIYRLAGYGLYENDTLEVHTVAGDVGPSPDAGG